MWVRLVPALLGLTLLLQLPADALTCAPTTETPENLIRTAGRAAGGGPFFDRYDLVVVGSVMSVTTDEEEASDTYGRTEIVMDVDMVLGSSEPVEVITLNAADPGWMSGYPFAVGRAYFVPVVEDGPNGMRNYTFLCDPIIEVANPNDLTTILSDIADETGLAYAVLADEEIPETTPSAPPHGTLPKESTPPDDDPDLTTAIALGTVVIAGSIAAVAALHRRRHD